MVFFHHLMLDLPHAIVNYFMICSMSNPLEDLVPSTSEFTQVPSARPSRVSRRFFLAATAALAAVGLAACGGGGAGGEGGMKQFSFGTQPVIAYGMFEVAKDGGAYKEKGVETNLVSFDSGSPELEAMAGGSIKAGTMGATPVLIAAGQGLIKDLKIVSITDNPSNGYSILSRSDLGTVADLKGKTVAGTAGSNYQYFLFRALEKFGMSETDINFVNAEPADAQAAFIAGRVDAIVPPESARFLIPERRPDTKVLFEAKDFTTGPGPTEPFDVFDVIVAPDAVARDPESGLPEFLAAFHGPTVSKLKTDPSGVYDQVTKWLNGVTQAGITKEAVQNQFEVSTFYGQDEVLELMEGERMEKSLQQQFDFLVSAGRAKGSLDAANIISTDAIKKAIELK